MSKRSINCQHGCKLIICGLRLRSLCSKRLGLGCKTRPKFGSSLLTRFSSGGRNWATSRFLCLKFISDSLWSFNESLVLSKF